MSILLRMVGLIWMILSLSPFVKLFHHFYFSHLSINLNLGMILHFFVFAGGLGLLFLKEWGRIVLLIAIIGLFVWRTSAYLFSFTFSPFLLKQFVFYGIFIVILLLPQSRTVTKK